MVDNLNLMFITNDRNMAAYASECGVDRIFVDLEINGKHERQGHLDTVISKHSMDDVANVRTALSRSELLVRLNPFFSGSENEINQAISHGADIIMLPMFRTIQEVEFFSKIIDGRATFIPLVETIDAANILANVVKVGGVSEIYFGLNDLHREMNLSFMFEPLQNGSLERLTSIAQDAGVPFGFGGVARVGEGVLPAELILSEHARLGSSSVILSRTFHRNTRTVDELKRVISLEEEIAKIRSSVANHVARSLDEIAKDKNNLDSTILKIVNG